MRTMLIGVRATLSTLALVLIGSGNAFSQNAVQFDGTNDYVTFGTATATLGANNFTIETWFVRTGAGAATSTGSGGVTSAIPLLAKGRGEADGSNVDCNYFLGIATPSNVLAVDYEDNGTGLNHPLTGVTPILNNVWYHAAATYDGATLRLYLNGVLEASVASTIPPRFDSIQHASLGSALTSTGVAAGFFAGRIDEARIWNVARSQAQIQTDALLEIASGAGLLGRWGLNDGTGTSAANSVAGSPAGTLTNGPTWSAGTPFVFGAPLAPSAPSAFAVSAPTYGQAHLSWTDNATDETGFQVERSTTGVGGPYTLIATTAANAVLYDDLNRTTGTEYCYRVRAVSGTAGSAYVGGCATTTAEVPGSLDLSGTTYASFGAPASLQLTQLTIEGWIRRDAPGAGTNTGTGGVADLVPILAKGRAEAETATQDINYIFGIQQSTGRLAADFEEGAGGASPSLNHPVIGGTVVSIGVWHHVAATYDGTTWRLYLDGILDGTLAVGQPLGSGSTVPVALGSALTSAGAAAGFFDGALDEVRIWNVARSQAQLRADANNAALGATAGLVARWSLDEGSGAFVNGSAGSTIGGGITGASFAWGASAPFNLTFIPPTAPSGLLAVALSHTQIQLTWTDNSDNETGFVVERSSTGPAGSYTAITTTAAGATTFTDNLLAPSSSYCYRVHATNTFGVSADEGPQCATTQAPPNLALDFAGSTASPAYASFGSPAALQLTQFTLEMWVRRDGPGEGTNTGAGGIPDAIPLIAKGRADSETATADINYLFGIQASNGVLCADFEEGAAGASPSLNHPITGSTPLVTGTWYHAAATYDGVAMKLYLNGVLEGSLDIGQPAAAASTVAVSLATALTSAGAASGFFNGALDEVRVWNVARTQLEIQSTANAQITTITPGLVARWGMDEGTGSALAGSAGTTVNGTVTGTAFTWALGPPFGLAFNQPPGSPVVIAPIDHATNVALDPSLDVSVSDPDGGSLTVTWYGRPIAAAAGADFTLIGIPDTQYYTGQLNGGTPAMFDSQMSWLVANRAARNIVYAGQLGDCTEHGDNGGNPIEWQRADASLSLLENPITTGLPEGIPYGVSVGNHDQSPIGNYDGTTTFYNQFFGSARFSGRSYYGGHFGTNNDNWYQLFSVSGLDFIVISFEYDTTPDAAVLSWADALLTTYSNRKAILLSHFFINTGNPAGWGPQGQATYDALKSHSNLALMLCGHVPGEGRRSDTFAGNTVHTLLSDYQGRTNGGNGWLRILEFSPANNELRVKTYSPTLNQFETDGDSQFTLPFNMISSPTFAALGSATVPSGSTASLPWPGRASSATYEWYATVTDGAATTAGPVSTFTTGAGGFTITASAGANGSISPSGAVLVASGASQPFTITPNAGYIVADVLADGVTVGAVTTHTFTNVTADHTISASFAPDPVSTIGATSPGVLLTTVNSPVDVPVTINRGVSTPVLAFSVDFTLSAGLTTSPAAVLEGGFLSASGAATSFQVIDHGGNHFTADGVTLGLPCGSSATSGTLFTIRVSSTLSSGAGSVTLDAVSLRDCPNTPLPAVVGAVASVTVDRSTPLVTVTSPDGGETWLTGSAHDITWTASDAEGIAPAGVTLEYSSNDGGSWLPVASGLANSGAFNWMVPATLTTTARVRVTAVDINANPGSDVSNTAFTVAAATTTALASDSNPSIASTSVTFTASVTPATATGSVAFFDGAAPLGTVALTAGSAALATSSLAVGTHVITAVYLGAPTYVTSTSAAVNQVVNAAATTVTLVAAPDPGVYLDSETLTATVSPGAASGTVEFFDGPTSLGSSPVAAGVAVLAISSLTVGPHSLTAQYAGDLVHAPATSATFALEVKARIVATAGANGSITPSGPVLVSLNATPSFAFAAAPGYHVDAVSVDGSPAALTSPYTFAAVSSNHTIDVQFAANPPVSAIGTLAATQLRNGNDGDGSTKITLSWTPTPPGTTVEVWRSGYGNYPEYDDGPSPGSAPVIPASYPPVGWTLTGVVNPGDTDEPASRDYWYYVAYVTDGFGTRSAVSNRTAGTLDYHLGDFSNGITAGAGDNQVSTPDLSLLGFHYGVTGPAVSGFAYLDVGPTTDFSVHGRPLTDNAIDFEDLVLLALNFTPVAGAPVARAQPSPAASDALTIEAPAVVHAGELVTVRLAFEGTGRVHGIAARLGWDPAVVTPVEFAAGEGVHSQGGMVLSPGPGAADGVSLAGPGQGLLGKGEFATFTFRTLASGAPAFRIGSVQARDVANHGISITTGTAAAVSHAWGTSFAPPAPNPFQDRALFQFTLAKAGNASLEIYSVDGRRVRNLTNGTREAGEYRLEWDGRDDQGQPAPAGIYYARLSTPEGQYRRMVTFLH